MEKEVDLRPDVSKVLDVILKDWDTSRLFEAIELLKGQISKETNDGVK